MSSDEMTGIVAAGVLIFYLIIWVIAMIASILIIVSTWKLFSKSGRHGWAAIIPFYSNYVWCDMAFGNGWYFLLFFIPVVNYVLLIYLYFKTGFVFEKGIGFGFGLLFLPFIFFPLLAFGDSEYDESKAYLFK